ncbi:uncharacterized protein JCM15063_005346 [Sporobolomyces koalae]|uniref:uncharacterized protein n=1 Tax=Sporobolomyces koalae TaxID=500713 RepID=UPI00317F1448
MSSFAALLAASTSKNAANQAALVKQEKEQQAQQRKIDLENHRKAEEAKRAAEERRKEREAREAREAEQVRLRKQALPKTNNLYQLKQERIKRGLNPDGSEDHLAGPPAPPKAVQKQSYTELLKGATKSRASPSASSAKGKGKAKEAEPVGLTREEKAARKRDALFRDDEPSSGAFALAKSMKAQHQPSSPKPLSNAIASTSKLGSSAAVPKSPASALAKKRHLDVPSNPKSTASSRSSSASSVTSNPSNSQGGSARDRLKADFKPNSLQKLYTVKRDTRTIEEIERDLKAKKNGTNLAPANPPAPKPSSKSKPSPGGSKLATSINRRRSRSPSSDSDSETSDSSIDRRRRDKKRVRKSKGDLNDMQRDAIWQILGKKRSQYTQRDWDSDEDSSDMEASGAVVLAEERRAARLASKEDAEEQERLRVAAEKKKQAKASKGIAR